jgi:hypothetical protein
MSRNAGYAPEGHVLMARVRPGDVVELGAEIRLPCVDGSTYCLNHFADVPSTIPGVDYLKYVWI